VVEIEDAGYVRPLLSGKSMTMSQLRELLRGAPSEAKLSPAVILGLLDCVDPEASAETIDSWQEANSDLTPAEFGKIMRRSSVTVAQWCAGGAVPGAYKLQGRAWRIPRASVQRFRNQQSIPKPKPTLSPLMLHPPRQPLVNPVFTRGRSI
jgi:hypothetical protein